LDVLLNQQQLRQEDVVVWASYVASLFLRTQKVRSQLSAAMVQKFGAQSQDPDFIGDFQYDLFSPHISPEKPTEGDGRWQATDSKRDRGLDDAGNGQQSVSENHRMSRG
jgi:hypothetical protein